MTKKEYDKVVARMEAKEDKKITPDQVKRLYTIATKHGYDKENIKGRIKKKFDLDSSKDLNAEQYDEIIAEIEKEPLIGEVVEEVKEAK